MALSNMTFLSAKPRTKPYKISDGHGLYLEVMPSGAKYWRLKYRFHGKEKRISFGNYPVVSVSEARKLKDITKIDIQSGIDPVLKRIEAVQIAALTNSITFEAMAVEWHGKQVPAWDENYAQVVMHRFKKYVFTAIGNYPITKLKPLTMLSCFQEIEKTAPDLSRRMKAHCSHVFKYAIATGRAENDPTYGLESALKKFKKGHYASISVDEFPEFICRLYDYRHRINRQTFLAIKMLLLTFVRTSELIEAKWPEIDFGTAMWIIPGERMKMSQPHLVPLSNQCIAVLHELKDLNKKSEYIFPSYQTNRKPMCKNTMLMAIKRMGYKGRMTGHGFRSLALGLLKEKLNYPHHVADRQLAHVPKSSVDRAYDRAKFLPQRIAMMQDYSNYVDEIYINSLKTSLGTNFNK